jgi:hypothetical protein
MPGAFLRFIMDLVAFILSVLDYYFISKAVEKHPEYDTERAERLEKQKYYNSLSDEEYEKVKKEEKQQQLRSAVNSLFFTKSWKRKDLYKIVNIFLILIMLISFKRLFL